jgi:hypothetical protein
MCLVSVGESPLDEMILCIAIMFEYVFRNEGMNGNGSPA